MGGTTFTRLLSSPHQVAACISKKLQQCAQIIWNIYNNVSTSSNMNTRQERNKETKRNVEFPTKEKTKEQILFGGFLYWVPNILLTVFVSLSSLFSYLMMQTRCCQHKHVSGTVNKPSLGFLITNQMQQQNEPEWAKPKSVSSGEQRRAAAASRKHFYTYRKEH